MQLHNAKEEKKQNNVSKRVSQTANNNTVQNNCKTTRTKMNNISTKKTEKNIDNTCKKQNREASYK